MLFYQLPLSFTITYSVFHWFNLISTLLVVLLLSIYQISHRNRLLRSACFVCFGVSSILLFNFLRGDAHFFGGPTCQLQAVILNYFYVALHGHFCFFMVNSCFAALGWSIFGIKSSEVRTMIFISAAWLLPILPTSYAIYRYLQDRKPVVLARHFYCALSSPSWPLFRIWFFLFSAPGLFFSFYLLYRTWRYRQKTYSLSKTTHIDKFELFRLILAIFLYLTLIGLSLGRSGKSEVASPVYDVPVDMNPFLTPSFCVTCDRDEYFCARLCPSLKSYLPVFVGCILFAMFGFGAVASKCYKRFYRFIFRNGDNDNSKLNGDFDKKKRGSLATNRRLSSINFDGSQSTTTSTNNFTCNQRQSMPFLLFHASDEKSPDNDLNTSSSCSSFSQVLHPNLSISNHHHNHQNNNHSAAANQHQHHPSLPSIDEDLEVLYMNVNNRPIFKRQFHRRFSEPCNFLNNNSTTTSFPSDINSTNRNSSFDFRDSCSERIKIQ